MPNHRTAINNIVPKGTAPDEPAIRRNRFNRKMIVKTTVGSAVAVMNAFFLRLVPPREA